MPLIPPTPRAFTPAGVGRAAPAPASPEANVRVTLGAARNFYSKLGVTPAEGNRTIPTVFRNDIFDASYQAKYVPAANGKLKLANEKLEIGLNPYTKTSFGHSDNVVAHEFAHRINEHIVPGISAGKSSFGKIVDESLADTFAGAITGNWTIGSQIVDGGLRSLKDPSRQHYIKDGKVEWVNTPAKFGEISQATVGTNPYVNVGPLNNAAYRIAEKIGPEPMAKVYLHAMRNHLKAEATPTDLILGTVKSAHQLFGQSSPESQAVRDAWKAVGVRPASVDSIK